VPLFFQKVYSSHHSNDDSSSIAVSTFLFIHQNFPGQFGQMAGALGRMGHKVVALGIHGVGIPGVEYIAYSPAPPERATSIDACKDFEVKVIRGIACAQQMTRLRESGFNPDVIVAHPGWGEALFCKDIWPAARLLILAEFFYSASRADHGFDPEFSDKAHTFGALARLRLKNTVHLHALSAADAIYAPTEWQRRQIPPEFRDKTRVIFDGIDTGRVRPDPAARIGLKRDEIELKAGDEVITFVNRNLEPYRGFHIFMRALPEVLRQRPNAHCLIVGADGISYGTPPGGQGGGWRATMLKEVAGRMDMKRVHFLGRLAYDDYLKVLQVSTCHIYLTYPFVLSWSCLEAMSAGCVVIGSKTGPVEEVIQDGINGLLTDFFDVAALEKWIIAVLSNPEKFQHLAVCARQSVVEKYDLASQCLPKHIALIEELVSKPLT